MVEESEFEIKCKKDMKWLHRNIPTEEIYVFAYSALLAAEYFLWRWGQWEEISKEIKKDDNAAIWVENIVGLKIHRDKGVDLDH